MIEVVNKVAELTLDNYKQELELKALQKELKQVKDESVKIISLREYFSSWEDNTSYMFIKSDTQDKLKKLLKGVTNVPRKES